MSFRKNIAIRPGKPLLSAMMAALSLSLPALISSLLPSLATAQTPLDPAQELANQSEHLITQTAAAPFSMFDSIILIYVIPLIMILSVLAWMLIRRRPHLPAISSPAPTLLEIKVPAQLIAQPPRPITTKTRKSPPPLPISHPPLPETLETTTESKTTTKATFSIQPAASRRQCTRCNQFYDTHLDECPNSTCALPPLQTSFDTNTHDTLDSLQRTQCTTCGRRYEDGTRYCYVDGMHLINDTNDDAAQAAPLKVCRICGHEAAIDQENCPHDDTELTLINPSNLNRHTPTTPLLICSKCRQYAMPGTAFCPNDGELLTPLLNAKFAALPASGFGPRRKLCRKCGTRYSNACTYCSQDGTPLTEIQ